MRDINSESRKGMSAGDAAFLSRNITFGIKSGHPIPTFRNPKGRSSFCIFYILRIPSAVESILRLRYEEHSVGSHTNFDL